MRHKIPPRLRFFLLLLGVVFSALVCSCTLFRPAAPPPLPPPAQILERLSRQPLPQRLRAWGSVKWASPSRKGSSQIALVLQRPDRLRVEGLSPIGTSVYSLSIERGRIELFLPSQRRLYQGRATVEVMKRLFSLPMDVPQLLELICGGLPLCGKEDGSLQWEKGDRPVVNLRCRDGTHSQRVLLDTMGKRAVGYVLFSESGEEVLKVRWEDLLCPEGAPCVPTKIQGEMPREGRTLRIRLEDVEVDPILSDEEFRLRIPPGVETLPLSPG